MVAGCVNTYVTYEGFQLPVKVPLVCAEDKELVRRDSPYSVEEILTQLFEINLEDLLADYVLYQQDHIRNKANLPDFEQLRLKKGSARVRMTNADLAQTLFHMEVDLYIAAKVEGYKKNQDGKRVQKSVGLIFCMHFILDVWPCHRYCMGPIIYVVSEIPKRENRSAHCVYINEYFLPVLYTDDYNIASELMLERFWPEALEKPTVVTGVELARRMHLPIRHVHLPADSNVMGRIFFDMTDYTIVEDGKLKTIKVEPATILINDELCKTETEVNSTIMHECSHMVLDTPFFFLQHMTGSCSCSKYLSREKGRKMERTTNQQMTPVDWMELQAAKLPAYLMLPEKTVRKTVDSWIEHQYQGDRSPSTMAQIVLALVRDFHVSKSMAKYRLVELGYTEAEGVMNYIDGHYIKDHGCAGDWPAGTVYCISFDDALSLYGNDYYFTRAIDSGRYVYVDGHFCLKSDQYVRQTWDGALYLTEYAKKHINECCLSFRPGRRANHACYEYGLAARAKAVPVTDRYNSRYSFDAEPGTEASRKEISSFLKDAELWADLERHFTDDFSGSLQMIMEAKGITQSELSLRFNVDRKIVYKLLNTPQPSIPHIVAACIALDVPYCIAETLLRKAGHVLRNIPVHNVYRMMLSNTAGLTVDKCNEILTSRHYPSLFQNS